MVWMSSFLGRKEHFYNIWNVPVFVTLHLFIILSPLIQLYIRHCCRKKYRLQQLILAIGKCYLLNIKIM